MKMLTVLALAATALLAGRSHGQALYQGPWCAIVMIGEGSIAERCDMRSFEMCQLEIRGQGASHCTQIRATTRWPNRSEARNSACNSGRQGHIACWRLSRGGSERPETFVMRIALLLPILLQD